MVTVCGWSTVSKASAWGWPLTFWDKMAAGERGVRTAAAPGPAGAGSGSGPDAATTQREWAASVTCLWCHTRRTHQSETLTCRCSQSSQRGAHLLRKQLRVPDVQPRGVPTPDWLQVREVYCHLMSTLLSPALFYSIWLDSTWQIYCGVYWTLLDYPILSTDRLQIQMILTWHDLTQSHFNYAPLHCFSPPSTVSGCSQLCDFLQPDVFFFQGGSV